MLKPPATVSVAVMGNRTAPVDHKIVEVVQKYLPPLAIHERL